jgi:DNA-directed RNA polymerase subunit H (RpoH/RPB5)
MEGYQTSDYKEFTIIDIDKMYKSKQLDMLVKKGEKQLYVKYHLDKTLHKKIIQNTIEDLFETPSQNTNQPLLQKSDTLIIIMEQDPNDTNNKHAKELFDQENIFIMMYNLHRLLFNCRLHELNPICRILSADESDELLSKYKTTGGNLPEISRFDPLAMSLFLRPGNIIEIRRKSEVSINSLYYRICLNS